MITRNGYWQTAIFFAKGSGVGLEEGKKLMAARFDEAGLGEELALAEKTQPTTYEEALILRHEADLVLIHRQEENLDPIPTSSCFPGGTPILTPTGYRLLHDLQAGDLVLSRKPTGKLVDETITEKLSYDATAIMCLHLASMATSLRTTAHHTLLTRRGWRRASVLRRGNQLMCVDANGRSHWASLSELTISDPEPVFNLHTTGTHTFIAGGVVAHNFTEVRWLRTMAHRIFVDPFVSEGASKELKIMTYWCRFRSLP